MRRLLGALLVVVLALVGACNGGDDGGLVSEGGGDCAIDNEMDVYSVDDGVVHTDHPSYTGPLGNPPRYTVDPPSGGDHLSPSVGPGVYEGDNVPPDGVLVHSLEHGYVILWYRPDIADKDAGDIEAVQRAYPRDVIVVQRPEMSVPVAATAWKRRLLCQSADQAELGEFVEDRRNQAPEKIPH